MRAAFIFSEPTTGYHCFNCDHKATYDPNRDKTLSNDMVEVMDAYNIPTDDWRKVVFANFGKQGARDDEIKQTIITDIEPKEIQLPDHFYELPTDYSSDKWAEVAHWYLKEDRAINPSDYKFFLSTGKSDDDPLAFRWKGRVIIPVYKDNKLIYYQGRDMTGKATKKYLSVDMPKDRILHGFERLFTNHEKPLYVVEGWFDAEHIDGVAVYGNRLSKQQIAWLSKSRRPKVILPDTQGDGHRLANEAISLGWGVSVPDIGDCKDIDEAVKRFGKLYVLQSIISSTAHGFAAQTMVNMKCKKGKSSK